jgi:hypothetical protein
MTEPLPYSLTAPRELPKPGPRKALTRAQIITLCIRQCDEAGTIRCGCGCGAPLDPVCIDEHLAPRETLPADRADHIDNRALFNVPCSKAKTVKDQAVIGHWRRVRQDSGQAKRRKENGPQITSRRKIASAPVSGLSASSKIYQRKKEWAEKMKRERT